MSDDSGMKALSVDDLIEMAGGIIPLSQRLGVARTTIHDWKRLGVIPGTRIAQISRELSVPAAELLPIVQAPRTTKVAA
jgi:predicted site-specific integrase-resolvase